MTEDMDWKKRVDHALFGNGQPGLVKVVTDHIAKWEERERGKIIYDERMAKRMNILLALGTLILGLLTFFGLNHRP